MTTSSLIKLRHLSCPFLLEVNSQPTTVLVKVYNQSFHMAKHAPPPVNADWRTGQSGTKYSFDFGHIFPELCLRRVAR